MKNMRIWTVVTVIAFLNCGCATVFKGTSSDIYLRSIPERAEIPVADLD